MKKIKKRLFAWSCILLLAVNAICADTTMRVQANEKNAENWSEDFHEIDSWGNSFPADSPISTVDEITAANTYSNHAGVQFRLDKQALCLQGTEQDKTPSISIQTATTAKTAETLKFDWNESDGAATGKNKLGVYYSVDGKNFQAVPLAQNQTLPSASNQGGNSDESGTFAVTVPAEQVTGTSLVFKIAVEDEAVSNDRTGFIVDNLSTSSGITESLTKTKEESSTTVEAVSSESVEASVSQSEASEDSQTAQQTAAEDSGISPTTESAITYDDSVSKTIVSFAGTAQITTPVAYADLNAANDFLNTDATFTQSNASETNLPMVTTAAPYSLGYKGFKADQYYQITCKSNMYGNLKLSFKMKGSNTGPKNFAVSYSTDGTNFSTLTESVSIAAASTWQNFQFTLPTETYNASQLIIRLTAGGTTINNSSTLGTGGTNYIQEIAISGNPAVSDEICGVVKANPDAGAVKLNDAITLSTQTEGATIKYSFDGTNYATYDPADKPSFTSLPATLTTYAEKEGLTSSVKTTYGYTQTSVAEIKGSPNGGAVIKNTKVKLSCATEGATISYSLDNGTTWQDYTGEIELTSFPATILAKGTLLGCLDSTTSTFSYTERQNADYNIYFGQIHAHTDYSDGAGSCDDAFNYAKNTADHIDFLAITDHSNMFDNSDKATLSDGAVSTEWTEGHALAKKYTDSTFVGIYGFEMTWSNGLGHINTFDTGGFQSRTQTAYTTYSTALQNYYAELEKQPNSISQFNHPGTTFGDFSDFAYYDEAIDSKISLIEVGNGEGAIGSSGYFPSYEYYTRALDKGWHLAPTNNQDNHKGKWGDANTARTVVLADSLTEDNIYDALRNMRVYATEDNDLQIRYKLNDAIMGSELTADSVGDNVQLSVDLKDPTDSAVGKVEVIVNGGLSAATQNVTSSEQTVNFTLPASYSYYYIKVTEPDGDIAVTSPVWIGKVEAVGISNFSTSDKLPITGEPIDMSLDLYNNEASDLNVESIEYSIDGKVIHTADLATSGLTTVPSLGTKNYTFNYTYNGVGAVNVDVTVKGNLNGIEKAYKGVLKLTYAEDSSVTHVVIDGTHYNDYVSGYYGGNMGNFSTIAAQDSVKVSVVKDQITADTLADCNLLIISAPAKKTATATTGNYTPSSFSDDFIKIVKDYVDRGGNLIVCGTADYQDTSYGQTSTEINKLLAGIGATTKLNSDELYDTDNNGGQAYRLYLDSFNKDTVYTSNIQDGQTYSAYSGCSVALDADAVASGKAVALVKGHDTSYSVDSRDDAGAALSTLPTVVSKGNVVALAQETLTSGAQVFVSGSVFMSDFEVKAVLDNNWDLPYANRTIIENIMNANKVSIPVTNISDVRKGTMGNMYAVEGYVTAGTDNASNTFFDTVYVQDTTGGIDIYPISQNGIALGTKMKIVGYLSQYQGDTELKVISSEVLDDPASVIEPTDVSTAEAADYDKTGGMLVRVKGTVTEVQKDNGSVSQILVKDNSGAIAKVFIDGYIYSGTTGKNTLADTVKAGDTISAVGIVYKHPEGSSDESVAVMRVRNCDEVVVTASAPTTPAGPISPNPTASSYAFHFNTQGGSLVADQVIAQGGNASEPAAPTKYGYTFAGWYTDIAYTIPWSFAGNAVNAETTVIAEWMPVKAAGITLSSSSLTVKKGKTYTLAATFTPEQTLDKSMTWSSSNTRVATVDSTGKIKAVNYGTATITALASDGSNVQATCTVRVGYGITYKLNSGKNSNKNPSAFYNEKITFKNPTRAGYTFKGWFSDKSLTSKITSISKKTAKNITVYAKWEKVKVDKVTIKSLSSDKTKQLTVTYDTVDQAKGYEIVYATNSKFTKDKTSKEVTGTSKTFKNLQSQKTYYVKIRAYKTDSDGKKVYGKYSSVQKVKVK